MPCVNPRGVFKSHRPPVWTSARGIRSAFLHWSIAAIEPAILLVIAHQHFLQFAQHWGRLLCVCFFFILLPSSFRFLTCVEGGFQWFSSAEMTREFSNSLLAPHFTVARPKKMKREQCSQHIMSFTKWNIFRSLMAFDIWRIGLFSLAN